MQTDSLALLEFFVEIVCAAADQSPTMSDAHNLDKSNSFFSDVEDQMIQNTSLQDLLNGQDDLLRTLAENWKNEIDKPWQMLIQIEDFINENKAYFNKSKIEVRTILDYVYTVV